MCPKIIIIVKGSYTIVSAMYVHTVQWEAFERLDFLSTMVF